VDPADATTWTVAPFAGSGVAGFANENAAAGALLAAELDGPRGLAFDDAARLLYVADAGNEVVRAIDVDAGTINTVAAGGGTLGFFGDGGPATNAALFEPRAIAIAPDGALFIADAGNERIRRVDAAGTITTVLGDGTPASSGEGAPAHA